MADLIGQLGQSFGSFSWGSIGMITLVVSIILGIVILFLGVFFFLWWKSYYIKVKIYEPYGQINLDDADIAQIIQEAQEGNIDTLKKNNIRFDMFKKKNTHGKYVKVKGTPYFATFMPMQKIEPVPMEYMFDDGVHLLRLSKAIMIPIPKPKVVIDVGEQVSISVKENNQWQAWNNMMADRINNKYQDIDAQKKAITYFVIGIVSMVLLGGFILWLIYSSVNKGFDAADKFNAVAASLTGGAPK